MGKAVVSITFLKELISLIQLQCEELRSLVLNLTKEELYSLEKECKEFMSDTIIVEYESYSILIITLDNVLIVLNSKNETGDIKS